LAGLSAFSELPALVFEQINRFVVCNSLKAEDKLTQRAFSDKGTVDLLLDVLSV
jgi:hypothetical protein